MSENTLERSKEAFRAYVEYAGEGIKERVKEVLDVKEAEKVSSFVESNVGLGVDRKQHDGLDFKIEGCKRRLGMACSVIAPLETR